MATSKTQFSTFYVAKRLYGLNVISVQEVTKALPVTRVPLAPKFVRGLINLRGQIATAITVKDLFELKDSSFAEPPMNVVCRGDGLLISLLVDQIGDVVELDGSLFEPTPDTIDPGVSRFMSGVYKTSGNLLSVLDIKKIVEVLQK
ncbi:MAG: chemotaxis protein CheW [Bdellovibrionia bacterium]